MRPCLVVGTAFLGLAISGSIAHATPIDFGYTGSLVDFNVPQTGSYQILAFGAQGGDSGGRGAQIGGDFNLAAGEILQIAVGGAGMAGGGGRPAGGLARGDSRPAPDRAAGRQAGYPRRRPQFAEAFAHRSPLSPPRHNR